MNTTFKLTKANNAVQSQNEFLSIKNGKASVKFILVKYIDKDTKQIVCSIPSLDITGYGENDNKAIEMIQFSLNDFMDYLMNLSMKNREKYLNDLGWKKQNNHLSESYVDINGNLQNFNAENNIIETLTLIVSYIIFFAQPDNDLWFQTHYDYPVSA
jgi:hypothetical protein